MLKNLKFPLLYLAELLVWMPLMAGFYGAVSFIFSTPITSPQLQGKSFPASWEAAVPNHGKFLEGYLIYSHPIAFVLTVGLVISSAYLLRKIQLAQVSQREAGGPSVAVAHKVANGCVVAALAAIAYFFIDRLFVEYSVG
jgi:hypothetical protein